MNGVLGQHSSLEDYRARDNLGRDQFWSESCPRCRVNPSTCWPAVQCITTVLRLPPTNTGYHTITGDTLKYPYNLIASVRTIIFITNNGYQTSVGILWRSSFTHSQHLSVWNRYQQSLNPCKPSVFQYLNFEYFDINHLLYWICWNDKCPKPGCHFTNAFRM